MIFDAAGTALGQPEFAAGARFGLVGLVLGVAAASAWWATGSPSKVAAAGLVFAAAVAAGLHQALVLPVGLAVGLPVLAAAGVVHGLPAAGPLALPLTITGVWLVTARSDLRLPGWALALLGLAIVLGGRLLADFDARWHREGLGPVLLALSVAGIYVTVPDTEQALVALGAALPLALLGWPCPLASLGRPGAYAVTGMLVWVVATGGVARPSAIIGGIACLGLLIVEPTAHRFHRSRQSVLERRPIGPSGALAVVAVHLGLIYVAARVAGLRSTAVVAASVVAGEFAVAVTLALLVGRSSRAAQR